MTTTQEYQNALGRRLRAIRQQQGLTLQDVEDRTDGAWKAVVIGSYERGDRAVSVAKLVGLARFYDVPMSELLPRPPREDASTLGDPSRVVLDLARLAAVADSDRGVRTVQRFARRIQTERGDYNGQILTLREQDVRALAAVIDTEPDDLLGHLDDVEALVAS